MAERHLGGSDRWMFGISGNTHICIHFLTEIHNSWFEILLSSPQQLHGVVTGNGTLESLASLNTALKYLKGRLHMQKKLKINNKLKWQ